MDVTIRHNPSFGVARCALAPNESMRAEAGAMMATSGAIAVESKAQGGFMKSLARSALGGESFFMTTFTAQGDAGWVDCAARLPGDVTTIEMTGAPLNISSHAFLCSSSTVDIDTKWGGFKNLFGGEGGFLIHATGQGHAVVSTYGAIELVTLAEGEVLVLDSGHMAAFDPDLAYTTRKVTKGIMQTLKSGEGLVFEFTGPGRVWTQSRNTQELVGWLTAVLPFTRA